MVPGMVFTIEPIFTEGKGDIYTWDDDWTAVTRDGSWSAQIEHEVLITESGVEMLTVLED
jgi:methionyl aminopeptidase